MIRHELTIIFIFDDSYSHGRGQAIKAVDGGYSSSFLLRKELIFVKLMREKLLVP